MEPGDLLLITSDGVIDCQDEAGERYGRDRLVSFLEGVGDAAPDAVVGSLLEELERFRAGREPFDDVTVLAVQRRLEDEAGDES